MCRFIICPTAWAPDTVTPCVTDTCKLGRTRRCNIMAASASPCCARAHGRGRARRQAATEAAFDLAPLQTDDGLLRIAVVLAALCHYAVRAAATPAAVKQPCASLSV